MTDALFAAGYLIVGLLVAAVYAHVDQEDSPMMVAAGVLFWPFLAVAFALQVLGELVLRIVDAWEDRR